MAKYNYKAKKGPQEIVTGNIEAPSEADAIEMLSRQGLIPLSIQELKQQETAGGSYGSKSKPLSGRVKSKEITIFSRQLASLLKSGVPILRALNIIYEQAGNPHLKAVLKDIHSSLKEGNSFSAAMSEYPKIFSYLFVAMVKAGEDSATLPEVLFTIAEYRNKQEELLSRLRMAMAYPILMAVVGIATLVFMFSFVIPRLMGIYENMGQGLPLPTQALITFSRGLREYWFYVVGGIIFVLIIFRRFIMTAAGKKAWSIFKLNLPLLGKITLKSELSRFCRTAELLIKNGIPILNAIDTAIPVLSNELIKARLKESYQDLKQGGSFGDSLKDARLFPGFMKNLIIVGEESGRLSSALAEVADSYERDTDEAIRVSASLLEPLMILVVGIIVGFIVVAMLLPIFEMNVMAR